MTSRSLQQSRQHCREVKDGKVPSRLSNKGVLADPCDSPGGTSTNGRWTYDIFKRFSMKVRQKTAGEILACFL